MKIFSLAFCFLSLFIIPHLIAMVDDFPPLLEVTSTIFKDVPSALYWLLDQDIFYNGLNHNVLCKNGKSMKIVRSGRRGIAWQCSARNCCNRSRKSIRTDSLFFGLRTPLNKVLLVIYLFLTKANKSTIQKQTKLHPNTIKAIIEHIYDIMEQSLTIQDVQIGITLYIGLH
jgi:hypothetical protein